MGKNILLITGSPRRGGNSDTLAKAFQKGAESAGHTVNKFEAAFAKLSGCRACGACWRKGLPCAIRDDFDDRFAPLYEQADVIALCAPLYFYGFPSGLQATLEKINAYFSPNCPVTIKVSESVLLACGGQKDPEIFSGMIGTYRQLCIGMHWIDRGMVIVPDMTVKGQIVQTDGPRRAEALGAGL